MKARNMIVIYPPSRSAALAMDRGALEEMQQRAKHSLFSIHNTGSGPTYFVCEATSMDGARTLYAKEVK